MYLINDRFHIFFYPKDRSKSVRRRRPRCTFPHYSVVQLLLALFFVVVFYYFSYYYYEHNIFFAIDY